MKKNFESNKFSVSHSILLIQVHTHLLKRGANQGENQRETR